MKKILAFISICLYTTFAFAQSGSVYNATNYAYTTQITQANATTGSSFIVANPTAFSQAIPFLPYNTNASITINRNAATAETVTPSTVVNCYPNSLTCTLSGTFTYKHVAGETIQSGTFGLQEAINVAMAAGSGTVMLDASWQGPSGSSVITAATGNDNVLIQDNRNPNGAVFYQWNGSAYAVVSGGGASVADIGALVADTFPGSDIGAKINAAGTSLPTDKYSQPTGTIQLQGSTTSVYYFSTTITLNTLTATLDCKGSTLVWTGANAATAFVLAGPLRQNPGGGQALIAVGSANGGIRDCNIQTLQSYLNSTASNIPANPTFVPSIATIAIGNNAGTGYVTGDVVQVLQTGSTLGTAVVTATDGVVTALDVLHGGYAYTAAANLATSGGTGSGLTVTVTVNSVVSCYPYNASPTLPTALFFGGDPTGNISGDSSSNYGNYQALYNTHISGFCGAMVYGNNSWQNQFYNVTFDHNYWGIDDELQSNVNSGERSTFHGGRIDGNTGANVRNDGGSQFTFDGTSFDYSEGLDGSSRWISGVPIYGAYSQLDFESVHIEDQCGPLLAEHGTYRGYINFHNGDVRIADSTACSTAYFGIAGNAGTFTADSVLFNSESTVPYFVSNPTNGASIDIHNALQGSEGTLPTSYTSSGQTVSTTSFVSQHTYTSTNPGAEWLSTFTSSIQAIAAYLVPNLPNSDVGGICVGVAASTNNCSVIGLQYNGGAGSASNLGALGIYGSGTYAMLWNATQAIFPQGMQTQGAANPFIATSTATTNSLIQNTYAPSLEDNESVWYALGVDASTSDRFEFGFHYVGASDAGNYGFLNLSNAASPAIEIFPAAITLNYSTTAPNLTDSALTPGDAVCASTGGLLANCSGYISSVFGRTGAVAATTGDYTAAQVTNAVDGGASRNTVNCSTSGSIIASEPSQGASYKVVLVYLNACNGTASWTYTTAYSHTPMVISQSLTADASASTTAVAITGTTTTGFVEIIGY